MTVEPIRRAGLHTAACCSVLEPGQGARRASSQYWKRSPWPRGSQMRATYPLRAWPMQRACSTSWALECSQWPTALRMAGALPAGRAGR